MPGVKGVGLPIKFVQHPLNFDQPAPALGAHSEEVYSRLLGLDTAKLQTLKKQGIV
jgi:crotonobetainyl-CoA:carnitine CoA-transferase CaiB-like acyl-CoA transferase